MNSNLDQLLKDKGPVLVEIYADWCPHCHRMMPVVADIARLMEGKANVYQFEIDRFRDFADELDVTSVPTFIIFDNGEEKWRQCSEMDGNLLLARLKEVAG